MFVRIIVVIDMVLLTITAPLMRDLSRVFLDISSLKMLGISSDLKNAVGNQKSFQKKMVNN